MGYRHFQIGCVFVKNDLFNTKNLPQFNIHFSRQEHQIDVYMYRLAPEILRFHPIPPFIFPLQSTVPLILYPLSFFLYSPFNPIPPFIFPLQSL